MSANKLFETHHDAVKISNCQVQLDITDGCKREISRGISKKKKGFIHLTEDILNVIDSIKELPIP